MSSLHTKVMDQAGFYVPPMTSICELTLDDSSILYFALLLGRRNAATAKEAYFYDVLINRFLAHTDQEPCTLDEMKYKMENSKVENFLLK